jgi:hypothetical protein
MTARQTGYRAELCQKSGQHATDPGLLRTVFAQRYEKKSVRQATGSLSPLNQSQASNTKHIATIGNITMLTDSQP